MRWLSFSVLITAIVVGLFWTFPGPAKKLVFDSFFQCQVFYYKYTGYSGSISIEAQVVANLLGTYPKDLDLVKRRTLIEYVGYLIPLASDIRSETVNISLGGTTVSGTWFVPPLIEDKDRVVLYFHGGGYVSGSVFSHSGLTGELARRIRGRVLSVEYRLAPESPHSAAIEDALLSYRWLIHEQNIPPNKIVIAGDSAGGGLTLLTLLEIPFAEKGTLPRPAAGVTFSAWTDMADHRPSYARNKAKDTLLDEATIDFFSSMATAGLDVAGRKSSKFSPIYAPLDRLAKLPPLFMNVGAAELLEDDTVHFAGKAKQADVDVTLKVYENMQHVFPLFFSYFKEADNALNDAAQYIINATSGPVSLSSEY